MAHLVGIFHFQQVSPASPPVHESLRYFISLFILSKLLTTLLTPDLLHKIVLSSRQINRMVTSEGDMAVADLFPIIFAAR